MPKHVCTTLYMQVMGKASRYIFHYFCFISFFVALKPLQQKANTSNALMKKKLQEDYHQVFCMSFHLQTFDTHLHIYKYDFLAC